MNWISIILAMTVSACLTLAGINLLVWKHDRRNWARLCFFVMVIGVIGLAIGEMGAIKASSPEQFGRVVLWAHLVYAIGIMGSLGFVHFYFGTGRRWLLAVAVGLRLLAVVMNFTTGLNLHIRSIHSLQEVTFLGERIMVLGEWVLNPWARLGYVASLVWLIYVVDASVRLWRVGSSDSRRRSVIVGGSLVAFGVLTVGVVALVVEGVVKRPFTVSSPFLGVVLAMAYELSRDVIRAAQISRELQASEAALRESEERMTLAVDAADFGIWIRDLTRNEIWASDKWRKLFGFSSSEPVSFEATLQRVHPDDRDRLRQVLEKSIEERVRYETEYRLILPDGSTRWVASLGLVEFDANGVPVRVRGASRDLTARKQAEQETQLLRQEIAHVGRISMMGQLATALAHEINQPLGAILRNAEAAELFMQDASPDLDEIRAIIADIRKDDERAGNVIDRMRRLLKRQTLDVRSLDVSELFGDVGALVRADAAARRVNLVVTVPDDLPFVRGDRIHLQQVLLNLIINGMDALDHASHEDRCIRVKASLDGTRTVEISVNDTGNGIPADKFVHVFDSFFTTKPNGMGMGLPISRTIVEAHGGRLWAENGNGDGATFRFTLPIAEEAAAI